MDGRARRYERQIRVSQIGPAGQEKLAASCAALVGLGALGSVAADLLARAGVGRLILIDRDVVEWSNLQRQVLYTEADAEAAVPKAEAAASRLHAINAELQLRSHARDLTAANADELLAGASILVDGTDNFATRYLLNDRAVRDGLPYVYAGVVSTYGMVGAIVPPDGPCLRCTYPDPPAASETPTCRSAGVLGPAVSVIAGLAALEVLRILVGAPAEHAFRYLDLWTGTDTPLRAARDPACPCCGARQFDWADGRRGGRAAEAVCGGGAVQVPPSAEQPPDLVALAARLAPTVSGLESSENFLRFQVDALDVILFADGRALVRGTEDPGRARAVLARTIGG